MHVTTILFELVNGMALNEYIRHIIKDGLHSLDLARSNWKLS